MQFYNILIYIKVDYVASTHNSAPSKTHKCLTTFENYTLHLELGVFRSSRATSIHVDESLARYAISCAVTMEAPLLIIFSLSVHLSSLSAELHALYLAVQHFAACQRNKKLCIVFTNTLFITTLRHGNNPKLHPLAKKILQFAHQYHKLQTTIAWIPSYKDIVDNEFADSSQTSN